MESTDRWLFTNEQLENTPSRKCGVDADKELSYRQQAANFIQDMGQRLLVSQLCINTAIVYMHRFYVFHSFTLFHRNAIAVACLFLAAKVEEQPRRLEHIIKVAYLCLHRSRLDSRSQIYIQQTQELVVNENLLLQTLGFDVAIDHPHTHVVRCCHMVRASKDLSRASYFLASNSLHLTTMCLQYKPSLVACFCIHLACKWSSWKIPQSSEGKEWYWYIDSTVTPEQLEQLTTEFLTIFDKCPTKLKHRMQILRTTGSTLVESVVDNSLLIKRRRVHSPVAGTSTKEQQPEAANEVTLYNIPDFGDYFSSEPLSTSTSIDLFNIPSTSTSETFYCQLSNLHGSSSQESSERTKAEVLGFVRSFLDTEITLPRSGGVDNAKRMKFDGTEITFDQISKQYVNGDGPKKYIYTNLR